tara:strand:- start:854 stop:1276 length:423 start_codon:yes stop_codon:yes gene_type:complete
MRNKIIIVGFLLTFSSCGIFIVADTSSKQTTYVKEVAEVDSTEKFIGTYDFTVFGVPSIGELPVNMNVTRDDDKLKSEFIDEGNEIGFNIISTEIEEDILFIDIYVESYGINIFFEIYVDGNKVSGYLADQFELEGTISR